MKGGQACHCDLSIPCHSTMLRCHLDHAPLSSRPCSAVISTMLRCHLDHAPLSSRPKGEISCSNHPPQGTTTVTTTGDFSLRFEMTEGAGSWPLPYRKRQDFSLALEMINRGDLETTGILPLYDKRRARDLLRLYVMTGALNFRCRHGSSNRSGPDIRPVRSATAASCHARNKI